MGLNSTWDDSTRANEYSLPLDQPWNYSTQNPIRGVNIGGWLSIEPWITPSLFDIYSANLGIVDEYTLTNHLGPGKAAQLIEQHYSTFVTEQTFADIQAAGLDHVRIPFPYWAVCTYPGDPYVPQIAWRYLLRGIEWARKHGLRVNLDLHALPGSQNGWNHSGRQGVVAWLNGTDGDLNGQRSLDVHNQLSTFFAQDRYKNIVAVYGLCNEPKMMMLDTDRVVNWTQNAISLIRKNNMNAYIAFGDGFLGLAHWQGKLQGIDKLILDAHQYVIFNVAQISLNHQTKIEFACSGWTAQTEQSMDRSTGFGPTINGEWSQADTDCAKYLNNVNVGSRWQGTMNMNDPSLNVLSPMCPPNSGTCECADANADPTTFSTVYKQWLKMFAEAQMASFEKGWGWFYWTWQTETSPQWSWKAGLAAGILPQKAYAPDFNCSQDIPDFAGLGLPENY
ncbi:glycoside hydrolase family 5 protein [Xylona heveae TC161]|uniref:glucan 1,3-beta-glucosidase n=1 Tax=Xylona heveae (strain CBS 132557 / TC161) TaxID=1328760 RepID=A0A165FL09_XYLHT|nr:glycoside hydrolase family 5 protein [Xylona heveae TC161]KZF21099.1 glycoside hydrolase family 5 protein [Xylona heveae TC161]